jgi:hypothetical protein
VVQKRERVLHRALRLLAQWAWIQRVPYIDEGGSLDVGVNCGCFLHTQRLREMFTDLAQR